MSAEYLPFDRCLERLKHSFIRENVDFHGDTIDFQHPGIRDLLLTILQDDLLARKRYIEKLSLVGLASLISGVPLVGTSGADAHTLVLRGEEELELLLGRIQSVLSGSVSANDLVNLMFRCDQLIPQSKGSKLAPPDVDLPGFKTSPGGRVLRSVVSSLASMKFYESNSTFGLQSWQRIASRFYELSVYMDPPARLEYAGLLMGRVGEASIEVGIPLATCLSANEPLIFRQQYKAELDAEWSEWLRINLHESLERVEQHEGAAYESFGDELSEFEAWRDEGSALVELARMFHRFSGSSPADDLATLTTKLASSSRPEPPEYDEDYNESSLAERGRTDVDYWSVDRLFEDL